MVHVDVTTVSRWENGRRTPSGEELASLALALQTTADRILHGLRHESAHAELDSNHAVFCEFQQSEHGKRAADHGWLRTLATIDWPYPPTIDMYQDMLRLLEDGLKRYTRIAQRMPPALPAKTHQRRAPRTS